MSSKFLSAATALAVIASFAAAQAPNDQPAGATLQSGPGAIADDNSASVVDGPLGSCGLMGSDLWYFYIPNISGIATVTTCSANATGLGNIFGIGDSVIAAFNDGGGFPSGQILCNDDNCSSSGLASSVNFAITAGVGVYVSVGGFNNSQGTYTVEFAEGTIGAGDDCTNAFTQVGPGVVALTATSSLSGGSASCAGGPDGSDQWVAYTALTTGLAFAATCPTSVNAPGGNNAGTGTYIAIYTNCPAAPSSDIACSVGGGGCGFGNGSEVGWAVTAGVTYYVQCGNWSTFQPFSGATIAFNEVAPPVSVFTDDCSTAGLVTEGIHAYNTAGYTIPGPSANCTLGSPDAQDGWVAYTPSSTGLATFSNCSSSTLAPGGSIFLYPDTYIAVWDGSTCPPTLQLGCGDGSPNCFNGESEVSIGVTLGSTYYVQVGSWNNSNAVIGSMAIALYVPPPPAGPGDDCTVAVPATVGGVTPYNSAGYTTPGPNSPCSNIGGFDIYDYWMSFVAPASGTMVASNCPTSALAPGGSATPTLSYISAWDGSTCPPTSHINCNSFAPNCGNNAEIQFAVSAGQTYYIQVGQWLSSAPSSGGIALALLLPPANDDCSTATPISTGTTIGNNIGASASFPQGSCGLGNDPDVWYSFTSTCGGSVVIDTCGSGIDTWVAVWDGSSCPPTTQLACNDQASQGPCQFTSQSYLEVAVTAGQTYYINVGGWNNNQGGFVLNVKCKYAHTWSVPTGPGSIQLENVDGPANAIAFSAVTLDVLHFAVPPAQSFPNGWFFGVPLDYNELILELTAFAPVFLLTLDGSGYVLNFSLATGSTNALAGATLWSVGVAFDPATGFASVADTTDPTAFTL